MNLSAAELLSLLLLPFLLGAAILRACGIGFVSDRLAYLGWCWVTGATGTALLLFAWLWTGTAVDRVLPLQLAILACALLLYASGRRRVELVPAQPRAAFPPWERALFAAAVLSSLGVTALRALLGNLEPLCQGDDAGLWALKAKIIYASGGFNQAFASLMNAPQIVFHKDYPLLNPLLHVWTFVNAGAITQVANRIPTQMFSLAFVLILAAALRRVARPAIAAALLLCVMSLPETIHQASTAYVDLMVAVGVLAAFDFWSRWRSSDSDSQARAWWRLFCLALAFTAWSKHEGLLYLLAMLAAWLVSRVLGRESGEGQAHTRPADARLLLFPAAAVFLTWSFNAWFGFQDYLIAGHARDQSVVATLANQLATRPPIIAAYFARHILLNPNHSNLLPLAFAALLVSMPVRIWRSDLRLPALGLLFAFGVYLAVFTATPAEITSHLRTAAERVSYQIVPAIALWLGAAGALLFAPLGADPPRRSAATGRGR